MTIRSLVFVVLVAACQDHSGADHMIGVPVDAKIWMDAPVDAPKIFLDARPDAPPTVYVRTCTNKNPVFSQGNENLTIAFVCATSADAGTVQVTLKGGSGSGAEAKVVPMTLMCGPDGMAFNNPLAFTATQQLLATHVTGGLFDVDCAP